VVIPRIESDLVDLFVKMGEGRLDEAVVVPSERAACTVMLVSEGYPGDYAKGKTMTGFSTVRGSLAFHAGTKLKDGSVVTNGGRVLAMTSYGVNIKEALERSYENAARIQYDGKYFRTDIGWEFL
jgi:phosphoribosylamine--glycine ligase